MSCKYQACAHMEILLYNTIEQNDVQDYSYNCVNDYYWDKIIQRSIKSIKTYYSTFNRVIN